jgi:hypothetical protein
LGLLIFWVSLVPSVTLFLLGIRAQWIAAPILAVSVLLAWPVTCTALFRALKHFASALPAQVQTVGDLAKTVVGLNYGRLVREFGPSREQDLHHALLFVIADITELEPYALGEENPTLTDLMLANDDMVRSSV